MASRRSMTTPKPGAEEMLRVNKLIESRLEGNGKLAVAYPFPSDAYLFVLYREIFGPTYGNGPRPLSTEEAAIPIKIGKFQTNRGTARQASLNVLKILADSMTQWPDENGEVDQTVTEQRLAAWLRDTTPAIDPPFTPTVTSSPSISSTHGRTSSTRQAQQAMDTVSEAGGVSLGQHSSTPYQHTREISIGSSATGQVQHENTRPAEPDIHMEEAPTSYPAAHLPEPTSQQVHSNDQASHTSQPPNLFAPQPLSMQQPVFLNMQTLGPSPVQPTAPAVVPSYAQIPYASMGWAHNPSYHQFGYGQVAPPFTPYGHAAPPFPAHGQAAPPFPAHGPWMFPGHAPLQSVYGHMPPMPPPQHFGFPQNLPPAGQQPVYVPHSILRRSDIEPNPLPTTPIQSRTTLPPAERRATSSAWAAPKGFNIAEWAQENRPPTPVTTSAARPAVQAQPLLSDPMSIPNPLRYRFGTARMYPVSTKGAVSTLLERLTSKGTPTFAQASNPDVFPFENNSVSARPPQWGVVQIGNVRELSINMGQIPYSIQRMEMHEFLGSRARLLTTSMGWPIHIILDRLTGKTMDCYVEFTSIEDARSFVLDRNRTGYLNKLGDRIATISMSTQDELLAQTFARATNVEWRGGMPVITESHDPFNSGFKGFISSEELVRLIQHAEFPHRSGYTSKNLQRPYECMISILYKFPWYAPNTYTIGQRNQIFAAANDLIRILLTHIHRKTNPYLHQTILEELLYAGLNATGFSDNQRWQLCKTAEQTGRGVRISPLAKDWPFEILTRKFDVPEDLMNYYVDLLTKHLDRRGVKPTMNPFRTFLLPPTKGDRFEATAKEQAELELNCVLDIYRMTLPKEEEKVEAPGPSGEGGQ